MAGFVKSTLDDGSEMLFESAESGLVAARGARPDVVDGGRLQTRLEGFAAAAEQVARPLRERLGPEEMSPEFELRM